MRSLQYSRTGTAENNGTAQVHPIKLVTGIDPSTRIRPVAVPPLWIVLGSRLRQAPNRTIKLGPGHRDNPLVAGA